MMTTDSIDTATRKADNPGLALRDLEYCAAALNDGSKSFLLASHFLPKQVRFAATSLYGFCREADDLIDGNSGEPEALKQALDTVQQRINNVYSSKPLDNSTDRALRSVVQHYHLPRGLLDALLQGFEWDTSGRTYQTLEEVEDYAARVAGSVGAMMAVLMGVRDPTILARACDLGVAMQLTNICRDVGEDARAGRCYLPIDWLQAQSVTPETILQPGSAAVVKDVIVKLLNRADFLYKRADSGIAMLPHNCQRGIRMARQVYSAIGGEIQRIDYDSINQRAYVPIYRKLKLLAKYGFRVSAASKTLTSDQQKNLTQPCLNANRFLVNAVTDEPVTTPVNIYRGLLITSESTKEELVTVLQVLQRMEQIKRYDLQANTGKVPEGFGGVVRS